MANVSVKALSQYGVVSDIAPFETPLNVWSDAKNVEFSLGGVVKSSNRLEVLIPSAGVVNKMHMLGNKLFYTTNNKIYEQLGLSEVDITNATNPPHQLSKEDLETINIANRLHASLHHLPTPADVASRSYSETDEWFITELGGIPIFNNGVDLPQYLPNTKTTLENLSGWSDKWRTPIIRSYKSFLFALGTTENGVEYKTRVRWSDIAQPHNVPSDWDATSTTNSAGFNDLAEAHGKIIDGLRMGDSFIIYTNKEVFQVDFVGGNNIFNFRKVLNNVSLLAPECACEVEGGHLCVTTNDVIIHNAHSSKSIVNNKIKDTLFQAIKGGKASKVKVQSYPAKNEVWICYPSYASGILDKAAVYNLVNSTWTYKDLPNVTAINYGVLPDTSSPLVNSVSTIVDNYVGSYEGVGKDFIKSSLVAATYDKTWYAMDEGNTSNGKILPASITKMYMDFDDVGLQATSMKQCTRVSPQIVGEGKINISIGVSQSPHEVPKWTPPKVFNIGKDYKADFRADGRYISIKFESFDNSIWKLMSYTMDIKPRGGR